MSSKMVLPKYVDEEVKFFHPICEKALNKALENLGLEDTYEILHHPTIGSLIPDFALIRKSTKKYSLFIEVKRTPAAVSSTRYKLQAQSYVQEAKFQAEKPYYALTNLEVIDLFKYSSSKPAVNQQIIEPSPIRVGLFSDKNPDVFFNNLISSFEVMINIAINDLGKYQSFTETFIPLLEDNKGNIDKWHQSLILAGYEYIRGVLKANGRDLDWNAALSFQKKPQKIIDNIKTLNFNALALSPYPLSKDVDIWDKEMLKDLGELGKKSMSGDEMAEIIHSIAIKGREHEGLVPTDLELANIISVLSRHVLDRELREDEVICDPAAGSGNLLASSRSGFENILPKQLWANDIETLFKELLSIRLGLMFPAIISPQNSAKVSVHNIINLEKDDFENVKVVLMNPPYVSGVTDPLRKKTIINRIQEIKEESAKTKVGQIGIEAPFLELVCSLVEDNTIISLVFPKQYLTSQGKEAVALRTFLLNDFGLELIFLYPREGIFEGVVKDTVVLVGRKNSKASKVKVIRSDVLLSNVDLSELKQNLELHKTDPLLSDLTYGMKIKEIDKNDLAREIIKGWKAITVTGPVTQAWIDDNLKLNAKTINEVHALRRGRIGNSGASDLLFINTNKVYWKTVKDIVPNEWLYPAIRRVSELNVNILDSTTTGVRFLAPPEIAFKDGTKENRVLIKILDLYLEMIYNSNGKSKQKKSLKDKFDLMKILEMERKKITEKYTVLIPRNIRRFGRVYFTTEKAYVSTNLIELTKGTNEEKALTHAWLLSIFAQLQFEYMAKDQEGTRKLEIENIKYLLLPNHQKLLGQQIQAIVKSNNSSVEFLDLCDPKISDIDSKWISALFPNNNIEVTTQVLSLVENIVTERFPEYFTEEE